MLCSFIKSQSEFFPKLFPLIIECNSPAHRGGKFDLRGFNVRQSAVRFRMSYDLFMNENGSMRILKRPLPSTRGAGGGIIKVLKFSWEQPFD
jgi:hypothetical protein